MPSRKRGIQYPVTVEFNFSDCDYWITRLRG
jgi:hypothetical protein